MYFVNERFNYMYIELSKPQPICFTLEENFDNCIFKGFYIDSLRMYSGGGRRLFMANKDGSCGEDDARLCAIVGLSHVLGTEPNAKAAEVTESVLPQFFSASLTPSQLDATANFSDVTVGFFLADSVLLSNLFVSVNFSVVGKRFEDDGHVPPEEVIFLRLKIYSGGGRRSSMVHKDGNNGDDFGGGRRLFMSNKDGSCGKDDLRLCVIVGRSHVLGTESNAKTAAVTENNAFYIAMTKTPRKFPNLEADESSVFPVDFPCQFKLDGGALAKLLSVLPQSYSATLPSPNLDATTDFFFTAYSNKDVLPPFDALLLAVQCRKFVADFCPLDRILARVVRPGVAVLHVELVCMLSRFRRTLLTFMKGRLIQANEMNNESDSGISEEEILDEGDGNNQLVPVDLVDFEPEAIAAEVDVLAQVVGQQAVQIGQLQAGQAALQAGQEALQAGQADLLAGQAALQAGQELLQGGQAELLAGQAALQAGQEALQQLVGQAIAQAAAGGQKEEEKDKEKPKEEADKEEEEVEKTVAEGKGEDKEEEEVDKTVAEGEGADKSEGEGEKTVAEGKGEDKEEEEVDKTVAEGEGADKSEGEGEKTVDEGEDEGTSEGEPKKKHPRLQF